MTEDSEFISTAREESETFKVVSFVRTHLPDIQSNYEDHVVTSNKVAFKKALEKLKFSFPENKPVLGYSRDKSSDRISAWIRTNNPNIIVRASKNINENEFSPQFLSIYLMGDQKVSELISDLQTNFIEAEAIDLVPLIGQK